MGVLKRLAVFASGSGTNFEAIARACKDGLLAGKAEIVLMVCDKPGALVVERAERFGIDSFVASPKSFPTKADYEARVVEILRSKKVDLICLAGYMRIVAHTLLDAYEGRIINIHPALLPSFKGAHGVEDAVAYGVKVYGITIHWVDKTIDGGKIIDQRAFYYDGSDAAEVHRLGQVIEHQLYVETIDKLLASI